MMITKILPAFSHFLRNLTCWRRYWLAFGFGLLAALAFEPINLVLVFWLAFPALLLQMQSTKSWRGAFWLGWSFAVGLLTPNLYWIAGALFVDIKYFWWALPIAVLGLPAFFALYYGTAAALARHFFKLDRAEGALAFALLWFLADYTRGHLFTGFPWDLIGYGWSAYNPMLQITGVIGIYGLTLLTLVLACLPAWRLRSALMIGFVVIGSLAGWGEWRLQQAPTGTVPDVRLRLIQANVNQTTKWLDDRREQNFKALLDLSFAPADKAYTHIIWPETASAYYLAEDTPHRQQLAALLPSGTQLITGVVRRQHNSSAPSNYYNSLIAVDDKANVVAGYDKFHLVPWGEYIPLRHWLPVKALTAMGSDFTPGDGLRTLHMRGLPPFSPLICYEAVFPGEVADRSENNPAEKPQFMLNLTNDAWYEHTTGPLQHFAVVKVRAIEEGLPLVRVANKGLVGVVDAYGRIQSLLGYDQPNYIDSDLPLPSAEITLFNRYGDIGFWLLFCCFGLFLLGIKFFHKKQFE